MKKLLFSICVALCILFLLLSINYITSKEYYTHYGPYTKFMRKVSMDCYKEKMLTLFENSMTYIELLEWVDEKVDWPSENDSFERELYPFQILKVGKGRCIEHSSFYVAACLAHGYRARLIRSLYPDDHAWAEVKLNSSWVCVETVDKIINQPYRRFDSGKYEIAKVVAYEPFMYEDITRNYVRMK